ncbi:MAG: DUF1552 domain-containing protein [Planctomycetia bacterium]|jgi:hypothetical protein
MRPSPRRTFLRGTAGAMLGLPWLESVGAAAAITRGGKPLQRVAFFYVPNGIVVDDFFPRQRRGAAQNNEGTVFPHLNSRTLKSLDVVGKKVTLITGLCRTQTKASDPHEQAGSCWLSELAPLSVPPTRVPQGRTLDHVIAEKIGGECPFSTLEFSCNPYTDNRESIAFDNLSWFGPDSCARSIRDPEEMYRRLFNIKPAAAEERITDLVLGDAKSMALKLARADQRRLDEYVDSVRSIERQMDRLLAMRDDVAKLDVPKPVAADAPRADYMRLMGEMLVVALQAGLTQVATFLAAPERWNGLFRCAEVSDEPISHHELSHAGYSETWRKLDEFYMSQFAAIVAKMDSIREVDGSTLLDNTMFTYGSGIGFQHVFERLPIVVAGSGGGRLKTGFELKCKEKTPLANLWLTQANAVGHRKESFADSTGELGDLLTGKE